MFHGEKYSVACEVSQELTERPPNVYQSKTWPQDVDVDYTAPAAAMLSIDAWYIYRLCLYRILLLFAAVWDRL